MREKGKERREEKRRRRKKRVLGAPQARENAKNEAKSKENQSKSAISGSQNPSS